VELALEGNYKGDEKGMKRYYYHITNEPWKNTVRLYPRETGDNRDEREPKTARICVAPTIEGCLVAMYVNRSMFGEYVYLYRTKNKVTARKSTGIMDSHITGEKWIVRPTTFVKIGELRGVLDDAEDRRMWSYFDINLGCLGSGEKEPEAWQRKSKKQLKRILKTYEWQKVA